MKKKCILSLFVSGILIALIVFTGCGNGGSTLSKNNEDKDQHITVAFTKMIFRHLIFQNRQIWLLDM